MVRKRQPLVPASVGDYIVNAYIQLRGRSAELNDFQYTSARTLLSVIRLGTALARLRCADEVEVTDIDEALRLIEVSKSSLYDDGKESRKKDAVSAVFDLIKEMCMRGNGSMRREVSMSDVRERVLAKGFTETDLEKCVHCYMEDQVWMTTGANGSKLRWLSIVDDDDSDEDL